MKQQILVTAGLTAVCCGLFATNIEELKALAMFLAFFTSFSWIDIYNEHKSNRHEKTGN